MQGAETVLSDVASPASGDASTASFSRATSSTQPTTTGAVPCSTCSIHLASDGVLVAEAYPESLDWDDAVGRTSRLGDVAVRVEEATRVGDLIEATVAYELGGRVWRQRFGARMLDEADLRREPVPRSRVRLMGRPRPRLVHGAAQPSYRG